MKGLYRTLFSTTILYLMAGCSVDMRESPARGLDISEEFPQYWAYHGKPVLLLGGSEEDNLFQMQGLEAQLDLLTSVGGNYVRNTMSSRDPGNVWPFDLDRESEKYDLNLWNKAYWSRFESILKLTSERQIMVQVEVWATFDFYRENWTVNPFNPANNLNYTVERIKLPVEVNSHPTRCENPFFWSIPSHQNNMPLLNYQQRFVDKLLSYSLQYDHILYCIDNETSVTSEWGKFWSVYIQKKAAEAGKRVHVTEMWDPWDLDHISHRESFDHPETYSYVEISQNNHQRGENQWNNGLLQIEKLRNAGNLRPANNIKTYGATGGMHGGGTKNGVESFIRSALFGSAAVRFHRPTSGLGLSDTAQAVIHGLRMATDRIDFFRAMPHNELLHDRSENEAYCRAVSGEEYLIYFPDAGEISLNAQDNKLKTEMLEILTGRWTEIELIPSDGMVRVASPGKHYIFIIKTL